MKGHLIVFLAWLPCLISGWNPIGHPASFSVHQTFSEHSKNGHKISSEDIESDSVDSLLANFNKNDYGDDVSQFGSGLNEGRILNGKSLFTGSENFNGLYHNVDDSCAMDKFAIDHEATIKYNTPLAKLDQFTLCTWMRFTKHDGDHVLFTYSVHDEPREIQFWVANAQNSSFINLAVRGHSLYRLNYPLIMKKWHHACTSWNGKTGEWQLWVKSERVGRGFYNRLVSHEIEAGGKAFSGGLSPNGPVADGLHFEITLLQLYKVALSAGKAHRDHKHHHVHHFDHNGPIELTTTARPAIVPNQPINPLLANGQIPTRVRINLAGQQQQQEQQAPQTINTNFVVGQFHTGARNLQQQLLTGNLLQQLQNQPRIQPAPPSQRNVAPSNAVQFPSSAELAGQSRQPFTSTYTGFGSNPANVQIIEELGPGFRFKRSEEDKKHNKRDLVTLTDGSIVDDKLFDTEWYDGLAQFGGKDLKQSLTKRDNLEDEIREHDREPAEGEVDAVRSYCNSCLIEPFQNALVLAWKDAVGGQKTLRAKASTICGRF